VWELLSRHREGVSKLRSGIYLPFRNSLREAVLRDMPEEHWRELLRKNEGPEGLLRKQRILTPIQGGAFANSGMYVLNVIDKWDNTQLALDLSLTTHKWAMYTNTDTPNFSTDVSYAATNEVAGTGYTAGGRTIAAGGGSPTVTESPAGTVMYDQNDMVWPSPTSVTARGAKLYADVLAGDNLIVAVTFGADFTSTAGTFTIQWAAGGVLTIDVTP
jgi:hypothetical protein